MNISAMINSLPICTNQDDRFIQDPLGLITPNMLIIGRNNNRAPVNFPHVECNPGKALENVRESYNQILGILGEYVHRFIPGKRMSSGKTPDVDDVVLFTMKEAQRSRNIHFKYGRIMRTDVDGRVNKVRIKYRNADEVVMREVERNIKDVILIIGVDEIDFNTSDHYTAVALQERYLSFHTKK